MLNIFLSGQKSFGAAVLALLLERGERVVGVAAPAYRDAPDGGKLDKLRFAAERAGVPWLPASDLRADTMPRGVDLIVCAHSHAFIGRRTRQKTRLGAIGYHPSLLPRHRGRDAVRWTVKMGDPVTGGSVFWLDDNVDAGPLAAQEFCFVRPGDTPQELWRRELFPMGLRLIARVLDDIGRGVLVQVAQDEALATWEPSWGRAPLYRPDLPQLGSGPAGYVVIKAREGLEARG